MKLRAAFNYTPRCFSVLPFIAGYKYEHAEIFWSDIYWGVQTGWLFWNFYVHAFYRQDTFTRAVAEEVRKSLNQPVAKE